MEFEPIDLNIGRNVLEHWNIVDALREIISNSFDEHTKHNIKKLPLIKKDKNTDYYEITDYGNGIQLKDFIQNVNITKVDDKHTTGVFGCGLKDAIGVLCKNSIDFSIITNEHIFKPQYIKRQRGETLHINVNKNNRKNTEFGTKFIFKNLKPSDIINAKKIFLQFQPEQPEILYEDDNNNKIFKLNGSHQSIYVNEVKVIDDSGYNFSYDINKDKKFINSFNRDRQHFDKKIFSSSIRALLKNMKLFDENNKPLNNDLFDYIKKILGSKNLKEFNYIDIIRNIIEQINNIDKYIFIGELSDLSKSDKENIRKEELSKFILNDVIRKKFKYNNKIIKNIKELYNNNVFYGNNDKNKDSKKILTISKFIPPAKKIVENIKILLDEIKKKLDIELDDDIRNKLEHIVIDDDLEQENNSDNDGNNSDGDNSDGDNTDGDNSDGDNSNISDNNSDNSDNSDNDSSDEDKSINNPKKTLYRNIKEGYDFSDEPLKISQTLSKNDNKLKAIIIYRYILPHLNESEQLILFQKLIEQGNTWFSWIRR